MSPIHPDQTGHRLVDLVAELEHRLTGDGPHETGRQPELRAAIPDGRTYVLVLLDGLGRHQLDHPAASSLRSADHGVVLAPFPTTTTVSLATIASGRPPAEHGLIGHLMWIPELEMVVNTLKWIQPTGKPVSHPTGKFLPQPNLWERLKAAGIEPITVQPHEFERSPLSRALYRGCRFEGVSGVEEAVRATADLAATPRRLVFTYFHHVDFAAHVFGQKSNEYAEALRTVDAAWSRLSALLPEGTVMVGTSDHGHLDYTTADKLLIRDPAYDRLTFFGDSRSLFVSGDEGLIRRLADEVGVTPRWVADDDPWNSSDPHPDLDRRKPTAILMAPEGRLLLPRGFDKRLIGYHGGLDRREVEVPLLVTE